MKSNKNGVTLISLVITIIILIILAGVSISYVVGDNGVISNAMKMDIETAKGEIRDHILLLLNEELLCASNKISGTSADIGTEFYESRLVNYLKGNQNFPGTEYADIGATKCIEEFTDASANNIVDLTPKAGETVKSKYRIISEAICPEGDRYGVGQNIDNGNIFTLEAVNPNTPEYEGKFELCYYDKDGNREVLETVALYMTNQS